MKNISMCFLYAKINKYTKLKNNDGFADTNLVVDIFSKFKKDSIEII